MITPACARFPVPVAHRLSAFAREQAPAADGSGIYERATWDVGVQ